MWLVLCCNAMATVKDDQPLRVIRDNGRSAVLTHALGSKDFGVSDCFTSLHENN